MIKIKEFFGEHKWALVLALLASIIVAFPQVYFRIDHRNDGVYQGIELLPDDPWSARVREVQDGHPNFGAIYYKDSKDNPYLFQPLGSMVVAYMGEIFSLDINNTLLLSRIVLTTAVFLLIYGFVFLISGDKLVALSSSAILLLAESVLSYSGFSQLLHGISPEDFLRIGRPVNPAMIYVLLFGFLIPFWQFYKNPPAPDAGGWAGKKWVYGIVSTLILGLNFYNYFYSWTYLYAFGGLLVLTLLIRRNWREALRISSIFVGALLVAIPYGFNLYHATLYPGYKEASLRFGVVMTHSPMFVGFVVVSVLVIFLLSFYKEDKNKYFFWLALLLAPFVTLNQQLLTGKILQAAHYHWFFHKPVAVILFLIIIFYLLTKWQLVFYKKWLAVSIIVASFATGVFIQTTSYAYGMRDGGEVAVERQKYGPVMKWLNENAEKEAVVFGNDETSHLTVIYTPLNVFYHRAAIYSLSATKERLLATLFTFYRLRGVGVQDVHEVFFAERGYVSASIYGMHYRELLGSYGAIPDEKVEEIVALYKATLSTPRSKWLYDIWKKYEVEYLVWDKKTDSTWQLQKYPFLKEAIVFDDIAIYRFSLDS